MCGVQAAAVDDTTRFRRAYRLTDGAQLLAVVQQARAADADGPAEDADIAVTLTTDSANDIVLHWGVGTSTSREWGPPPAAIVPKSSSSLRAALLPPSGVCLEHEPALCKCGAEVLPGGLPAVSPLCCVAARR